MFFGDERDIKLRSFKVSQKNFDKATQLFPVAESAPAKKGKTKKESKPIVEENVIRKFCNSHSTIKDIIGNKFIDCWTPLNSLESAKDDKSMLIFRPTTLIDPDGDGPKLPDLPFILFMKLRNGRIELDLTNPLKCQRAAVEGHSLASIFNLTVVDRQILYTMIGTRKQFVFKAFNLGSTLSGKQSWMGGRI